MVPVIPDFTACETAMILAGVVVLLLVLILVDPL